MIRYSLATRKPSSQLVKQLLYLEQPLLGEPRRPHRRFNMETRRRGYIGMSGVIWSETNRLDATNRGWPPSKGISLWPRDPLRAIPGFAPLTLRLNFETLLEQAVACTPITLTGCVEDCRTGQGHDCVPAHHVHRRNMDRPAGVGGPAVFLAGRSSHPSETGQKSVRAGCIQGETIITPC